MTLSNLPDPDSSLIFDDVVIKEDQGIIETNEQQPQRRLLGLHPKQLFILLILLFFMVFLLGSLLLLVSGRIAFPFQ